MLAPWLELPRAARPAALAVRGRRARPDPAGHTADADEIRDTAVTQPLLVATALAAAAELELPPASPDVGRSPGTASAS